jgi:hypothetical protein
VHARNDKLVIQLGSSDAPRGCMRGRAEIDGVSCYVMVLVQGTLLADIMREGGMVPVEITLGP